MKRLYRLMLALASAMSLPFSAVAEAPDGYYSSCEGKTGEALLKALASVVSSHTNVGYDGLWDVYRTSDVRPDGTLWDIYTTKHWNSNFTKCGNYKLIGDCVNREHSMPKSWWGGGKATQYSDAFHLYPTDGKVNGQRSNYPYGECSGGKRLPNNGSVQALGRLGASTFAGYSGTVFEPDDMYKGDLARSYFYMATAYNSSISSWTQGNGKEMLAGNSYPVFNTWAVNLLLKWSRQDPVSDKETDRNDAIYAHQRNRNPFIDHPELVEYIWGDRKGQAWYVGADLNPAITNPVPSSVIDLGTAAVGVPRSITLNVQGNGLKENLRVSVAGTGFTVSATTLQTSQVNASGAPLTVTYSSAAPATATGTLTLSSDEVNATYTLHAAAVDGLPLSEPTDITESSFVLHWSNIDGPDAYYTVEVTNHGTMLDEFPMMVKASDESLLVESLDPETEYTCVVKSPTLTSRAVTVTTLAPQPSIQLLYDGDLEFTAMPGEPSEIAEILLDIDNIADDIHVAVQEPFRISTDKSTWSTAITLSPEEDRFYMQLLSEAEGTYSTSVILTAGDYINDDVDITGTVSDTTRPDFLEDFETMKNPQNSYSEKTAVTDRCTWLTNASFNTGDKNNSHSGTLAARTGKASMANRHLTMAESRPNGIGRLAFWARLWSDDTATATFAVEVSADGGATWQEAGTVDIPSTVTTTGANEYAPFTLDINRKGAVRLRLRQTAGGRCLIDDISLTPCAQSSISEVSAAEYHSWDAYARHGELVLESDGRFATPDVATVYSTDGTLRFNGAIPAGGSLSLPLPAGLYLVTVRDFTRRVLIR